MSENLQRSRSERKKRKRDENTLPAKFLRSLRFLRFSRLTHALSLPKVPPVMEEANVTTKAKKKIVMISGPSCVGKGPLLAALKKFHPEIKFGQIPVIKSHGSRNNTPRPDEKDIWDDRDYFMPDSDFPNLDRNRYLVGDCRGFPQAIDLDRLLNANNSLLIMEVYYTIGAQFKNSPSVAARLKGVDVQTIFVSPVAPDELASLGAAGINTDEYVFHLMVNKQVRRSEFMGQTMTKKGIADIISRAKDAPHELRALNDFTSSIVCREGEGSPLWNRNPRGVFRRRRRPAGDAALALAELVRLIK
ncbi:MAG: hypothetical protein LBS59_01375 [Puniceicoccales bacterium]|nr:hypothetical protein [Puniceicoccales bacterium]